MSQMALQKRWCFAAAIAGLIAAAFVTWQPLAASAQDPAARVAIDSDDIGGVVRSSSGPEAGVWVIAETTNLDTKFRKIVVTDELGRFVVPDLPKANYKIWVRGYGLVDSPSVTSVPGRRLTLNAVPAASPRAAAEVYPSTYWFSLIHVPPKSDFPGSGPNGNGIAPTMRTQIDWLYQMKIGCVVCHPIGSKATREFPPSLGRFNSSLDAWAYRVKVGQDHALVENNAEGIYSGMNAFGRQRGLQTFADWTDRIAAGAVPPAPLRPQGLERNLVLTMWDWGRPTSFVHDEVTSDRRDPTVNPNGLIYGNDFVHDKILVLDPVKHTTLDDITIPVIDPSTPSSKPQNMIEPSPYWGNEIIWNDPANPNHLTMDEKGRVWLVSRFRAPERNPAFCKEGSRNKFANYFPLSESQRQVTFYDPKTKQMTLIDTCFDTHHINFAEDEDSTAFISSGTCPKCDTGVVGWINKRVFDQTHDAEAAQGWCPFILDYNADGKIGPYTQPNQPADPTLDRRVGGPSYGIVPNPVDGSVWFAQPGLPGRIIRLELGSNPPQTCRAEVYEPPFNNPKAPRTGFTPRGINVDRSTGVIWTALAGSGHLASFDRRKCAVLNGPTATGQHCPEGWTLHPTPGPRFEGISEEISVDYHYYNWVDQFDTLGLGKNIPVATGNGSSSMLALLPDGMWVVLRVPYPLGFFARGLDGRIDDPKSGWKGRGMYADYGLNAVWHMEGGKGTRGEVVKFQMRPSPLAK
jgi:hypothetical protein